jgi:hypothetical protein
MNDWLVLAASAAVVAFMVTVAALLGFRARASIDAHELERLLALYEPGARVAESAFATDGSAALARLTDGKLLIAKRMGDRVTLRIHALGAVKLAVTPGEVSAAFADLSFPILHMKLNDPPRWLADLAAGCGGKA